MNSHSHEVTKMNLKTLNLTVLLVAVLVLAPTIQIVLAQGSTLWISSGIYPHGVSYSIWREGSAYYAKNAYGSLDYSGTNASVVIQNALTNGGSGVYFFSGGIYVIDATIILDGRAKSIVGEGSGHYYGSQITQFKLADGTNTDVFKIGTSNATLARDMKLKHFSIDGNKANNPSGGDGIVTSDSVYQEEGYVEDVMVFACKGAGYRIKAPYWTLFDTTADSCDAGGYIIEGEANDIYILDGDAYGNPSHGFIIRENAIYPRLTDCRSYLNSGHGYYLNITRGSFIGNRAQDNGQDGFHLYGGLYNKFTSCVSTGNGGSGFVLYGDVSSTSLESIHTSYNDEYGVLMNGTGNNLLYHNTLSNSLISFSAKHGLYLVNARDNIFSDNIIVDGSRSASLTYDDVRLEGISGKYSTYNLFEGNKIRNYGGYITVYGINEVDANQDYNVYLGNQVTGQNTMCMRIQGANSKVNHCWNGTSWIS